MQRSLHVGFTGTQKGVTESQFSQLVQAMLQISASHPSGDIVLHHGDCIGADAVAHGIAVGLGWLVVKHPANIEGKRACCEGGIERPAKAPLKRNKDIVNETSILIACPYERSEILRSGTWSTVRYARARSKKVILLFRSRSEHEK